MRLDTIWKRYRDQAAFYCVYIQEAHPTDGWQVEMNISDDVLYAQPENMEQRLEVAQTCALRLDFEMPMLIDEMSNEVDAAYAALPERLYVIDADGIVAYQGDPGPFGFDPVSWEAAIVQAVGGRPA